jgi:transcriptional regulator with XRE-family HTH domain
MSNGQRLKNLRLAKGWKQPQLAAATGYSVSAIGKFERGERSLDSGQVVLKFAKALDCHPTQITGTPYPVAADDRDGQIAAGAVTAVHRALLVHGRPPRVTDEEATGVDLDDLAVRVAAATDLRQRAALARTAEVLPALLRDLQVAVAVLADGPQRRRAYGLLTSGYECAMQFAYKMGHTAIATLATERVVWAALETGDPLRVLSARWYEAGEFIALGEHSVAGDIIDHALVELDEIGSQGPKAVSLRGAMHLKAALNHARAADLTAAEMSWRHAVAAAEQLGADRNDFQLMFGPTNAAIWGVTIPLEFGRGREAVRRAESVRLPAGYGAERSSHFFIDLGRARWHNADRDGALEAFLRAEKIAPQQTRLHSGLRETVATMIRTARPGLLQEFALRARVL